MLDFGSAGQGWEGSSTATQATDPPLVPASTSDKGIWLTNPSAARASKVSNLPIIESPSSAKSGTAKYCILRPYDTSFGTLSEIRSGRESKALAVNSRSVPLSVIRSVGSDAPADEHSAAIPKAAANILIARALITLIVLRLCICVGNHRSAATRPTTPWHLGSTTIDTVPIGHCFRPFCAAAIFISGETCEQAAQ